MINPYFLAEKEEEADLPLPHCLNAINSGLFRHQLMLDQTRQLFLASDGSIRRNLALNAAASEEYRFLV